MQYYSYCGIENILYFCDMILGKRFAWILKCFMLSLFVVYYSGISMFNHVHYVDGHYIVHSHFYIPEKNSSEPVKKHSHPISAYFIISHLDKIQTSTTDFHVFCFSDYLQLLQIIQDSLVAPLCGPQKSFLQARAPPVV